MIVHQQYKGGAYWRLKKPSHTSISKAPGALFRKKYGIIVYVTNLLLKIVGNPVTWTDTVESKNTSSIIKSLFGRNGDTTKVNTYVCSTYIPLSQYYMKHDDRKPFLTAQVIGE